LGPLTRVEEDDRLETSHLDVINADVTQDADDVVDHPGNQPSNGRVGGRGATRQHGVVA